MIIRGIRALTHDCEVRTLADAACVSYRISCRGVHRSAPPAQYCRQPVVPTPAHRRGSMKRCPASPVPWTAFFYKYESVGDPGAVDKLSTAPPE